MSETWELTWTTMVRALSGPILTRIRSMLSHGVCSPAKRLPNPPSLRKLHSSLGRFVRSFSFFFSAHHTFTGLRVRLLIFFLVLQEEAFDIWTEWSLLYPRNAPSRKLLEGIANEWWLVSLIHHDYKDQDALWRFLLEDLQ